MMTMTNIETSGPSGYVSMEVLNKTFAHYMISIEN